MSTDTVEHATGHLHSTIAYLNLLLRQEVDNHRASLLRTQECMQAWEMSHASLATCLQASNAYVLFLEKKVHQLMLENERQTPETHEM